MHLKLVAALALFAVCNASLLAGNAIYVRVTGDNIFVKNKENGQQVDIVTRQLGGLAGQNIIQVRINGPEVTPRTVQVIDKQVTLDGKYQSDILYQIFKRYDGQIIDEQTYIDFITTIARLVEDDKVDPVVLRALQTVTPRLQNTHVGYPYNQLYNRQQERLFQGINDKETPYNRLGYLQAPRGYLRGYDNVELPENLEVAAEFEDQRESGIRNILPRQQRQQYGLGIDDEYQGRYGLGQQIYGRGLGQTQRSSIGIDDEYQGRYGLRQQIYGRGLGQTQRSSILRKMLLGIPEERSVKNTITSDRLTNDLFTLDNVADQVQRQIPTVQKVIRVEDVIVQRPQRLGLGLREPRNQWADRNILDQYQRRIPVMQQQQVPFYGVPVAQRQLFNRYNDIVY